MKFDIENLPSSPEFLHQIILDLQHKLTSSQTELLSYKEKYVCLMEEIRLARQQRFAPSSEKNSLQLGLFDEAGIELSEETQAQLEDDIKVEGYTRKKHPVRHPLPSDIPREIILHDIAESEKTCDCCHGALNKIGEETTEQLKFIPATLSVLRHVRPKYACKRCQEGVKIAEMPMLLLPKSIATPELVAHTIVAKYVDHLPLYRQEAIWQRLSIDLPRSSLCGWIIKTAELCEPLVALLKKNIIQSSYVQADETPVQVLNEVGRDNQIKSYMWVYQGGDLKQPSRVFDYQETRGGYHAEAFLKDFKGFLQTDAYSGYLWTEKIAAITAVYCMAHARRPFAELAKLNPGKGVAREALKLIQNLYAIEKIAHENELSPEARYLLRQEKAPPIVAAFKEWLDYQMPKAPEQSKLGKAIAYCLNHWKELTNYLLDGHIEIDNNLVENAIRPFAIGRKNWLFSGSPNGARAGALLYSLLGTCKANQIEPYRYLCVMLNRIRLCKTEEDYRQLLPQFIQL